MARRVASKPTPRTLARVNEALEFIREQTRQHVAGKLTGRVQVELEFEEGQATRGKANIMGVLPGWAPEDVCEAQ